MRLSLGCLTRAFEGVRLKVPLARRFEPLEMTLAR